MIDEVGIPYIIGQGFGVLALFFSCVKYFKKKKTEIIGLSLITYTCYIIHYFLIGAIAGAYALSISIIRDLYIYQREKHHRKHRHRVLYNNAIVFIALFTVYAILIIANLHNPLDILPILSGIMYLTFEWFTTNKTTLKFAAGFTTIPWVFFDIMSLSVPGTITDIITLVACATGISKDKKLRKYKVKHNH